MDFFHAKLARRGLTMGDQVQVIGYCVTADIIFFNPCLELVEIV